MVHAVAQVVRGGTELGLGPERPVFRLRDGLAQTAVLPHVRTLASSCPNRQRRVRFILTIFGVRSDISNKLYVRKKTPPESLQGPWRRFFSHFWDCFDVRSLQGDSMLNSIVQFVKSSCPRDPPGLRFRFPNGEPPMNARRHNPGLLPVVISLSGCGLLLAAFVWWTLATGTVPGVPLMPPTDPDRAAVEAWLLENLDDPEFEVVRWWGARDLYAADVAAMQKTIAEERAKGAAGDLNTIQVYEREIAGLQGIEMMVARMKFRTRNEHGAMVLKDFIFRLDDGVASVRDRDGHHYSSTFPD